MDEDMFSESVPQFYGSTTIGERGQIVIPAEARKDLDLPHSTKVMVFRVGPFGEGLLILKADSVAKMITRANLMISGMKDFLDTDNHPEQETNKNNQRS